jgi:hypothetical protein
MKWVLSTLELFAGYVNKLNSETKKYRWLYSGFVSFAWSREKIMSVWKDSKVERGQNMDFASKAG